MARRKIAIDRWHWFSYNHTLLLRKEAAIPVRLSTGEKEQLTTIAKQTGLTVSTIVRLLVSCFVDAYDKKGNHLELPLNWQEIIRLSGKDLQDRK